MWIRYKDQFINLNNVLKIKYKDLEENNWIKLFFNQKNKKIVLRFENREQQYNALDLIYKFLGSNRNNMDSLILDLGKELKQVKK